MKKSPIIILFALLSYGTACYAGIQIDPRNINENYIKEFEAKYPMFAVVNFHKNKDVYQNANNTYTGQGEIKFTQDTYVTMIDLDSDIFYKIEKNLDKPQIQFSTSFYLDSNSRYGVSIKNVILNEQYQNKSIDQINIGYTRTQIDSDQGKVIHIYEGHQDDKQLKESIEQFEQKYQVVKSKEQMFNNVAKKLLKDNQLDDYMKIQEQADGLKVTLLKYQKIQQQIDQMNIEDR